MFSRDTSRKSMKFLRNPQLCLYPLLVATVESIFFQIKQMPFTMPLLELRSNFVTFIQAELSYWKNRNKNRLLVISGLLPDIIYSLYYHSSYVCWPNSRELCFWQCTITKRQHLLLWACELRWWSRRCVCPNLPAGAVHPCPRTFREMNSKQIYIVHTSRFRLVFQL